MGEVNSSPEGLKENPNSTANRMIGLFEQNFPGYIAHRDELQRISAIDRKPHPSFRDMIKEAPAMLISVAREKFANPDITQKLMTIYIQDKLAELRATPSRATNVFDIMHALDNAEARNLPPSKYNNEDFINTMYEFLISHEMFLQARLLTQQIQRNHSRTIKIQPEDENEFRKRWKEKEKQAFILDTEAVLKGEERPGITSEKDGESAAYQLLISSDFGRTGILRSTFGHYSFTYDNFPQDTTLRLISQLKKEGIHKDDFDMFYQAARNAGWKKEDIKRLDEIKKRPPLSNKGRV